MLITELFVTAKKVETCQMYRDKCIGTRQIYRDKKQVSGCLGLKDGNGYRLKGMGNIGNVLQVVKTKKKVVCSYNTTQ